MIRLSGLLLVGQLVAGGMMFPALSARAADQAPAVDVARGKAIAGSVCAACHGPGGNSVSDAFPKLAGQHPEYIVKQLHDFKVQRGAKAPERKNPIMMGIASTLSEADMKNVAAYFAEQTPQPGVAHDAAMVAVGQRLWRGGNASNGLPACAGCHGPAGAGVPAQFPRLAGQWPAYTAAQLTAFQQGTRANSAPMRAIALRLTDEEVKSLADFIAGLR